MWQICQPRKHQEIRTKSAGNPFCPWYHMVAWKATIMKPSYTGSTRCVFAFLLGGKKTFFFSQHLEIWSHSSPRIIAAYFVFFSTRQDHLRKWFEPHLKAHCVHPFSGPANLATGPKPALGSKFSLEARETTICLCVIPCGKKSTFHWLGSEVSGWKTNKSVLPKKEHSFWRAPSRKAQHLTIDVTWHRHSLKWRQIEVPSHNWTTETHCYPQSKNFVIFLSMC